MRISDWSSDVCSSDLIAHNGQRHEIAGSAGDLAARDDFSRLAGLGEIMEDFLKLRLVLHRPELCRSIASRSDLFRRTEDRPTIPPPLIAASLDIEPIDHRAYLPLTDKGQTQQRWRTR